MELSVKRDTSDNGSSMAIITLGWCTVEVYESDMRPGGITVQVDCEEDKQLPLLAIDLGEMRLHPDNEAQMSRWTKAWLLVPETWEGGSRRVKIVADYAMSRVINGVIHYWVKVTVADPHLKRDRGTFMPETLIEER